MSLQNFSSSVNAKHRKEFLQGLAQSLGLAIYQSQPVASNQSKESGKSSAEKDAEDAAEAVKAAATATGWVFLRPLQLMGSMGSLLKSSVAKILWALDLPFDSPPRPRPMGVVGAPKMSSIMEDEDDPNPDQRMHFVNFHWQLITDIFTESSPKASGWGKEDRPNKDETRSPRKLIIEPDLPMSGIKPGMSFESLSS